MTVQQTSAIVEGSAQARSGAGVGRELRPGWGTGRRTRPRSRPARPLAAPRLAQLGSSAGPIGCRVERPVAARVTQPASAPPAVTYRLTDRGIALVLAAGLVIAAAAFVVVSLTALRVTGDAFVSMGSVSQPR